MKATTKNRKRCWFCHAGAKSLTLDMHSDGTVFVRCQECRARGPAKKDGRAAMKAWEQVQAGPIPIARFSKHGVAL